MSMKLSLLSEGAWIDRFVLEAGRLGAPLPPDVLIDLASEFWSFLGELPPEAMARANWDAVAQG